MANNKKVYYLPPERYYFDYCINQSVQVSCVSQKGLYATAYSAKQARIYIIQRIAHYCGAYPYDIDIDVNDLIIRER